MALFGTLVVLKKNGKDGSKFPITSSSCVFGRGSECDVRINLPDVSQQHCRLDVKNGRVCLNDISINNQTLLNGSSVKDSVILNNNDIISVSNRQFRFETMLKGFKQESSTRIKNIPPVGIVTPTRRSLPNIILQTNGITKSKSLRQQSPEKIKNNAAVEINNKEASGSISTVPSISTRNSPNSKLDGRRKRSRSKSKNVKKRKIDESNIVKIIAPSSPDLKKSAALRTIHASKLVNNKKMNRKVTIATNLWKKKKTMIDRRDKFAKGFNDLKKQSENIATISIESPVDAMKGVKHDVKRRHSLRSSAGNSHDFNESSVTSPNLSTALFVSPLQTPTEKSISYPLRKLIDSKMANVDKSPNLSGIDVLFTSPVRSSRSNSRLSNMKSSKAAVAGQLSDSENASPCKIDLKSPMTNSYSKSTAESPIKESSIESSKKVTRRSSSFSANNSKLDATQGDVQLSTSMGSLKTLRSASKHMLSVSSSHAQIETKIPCKPLTDSLILSPKRSSISPRTRSSFVTSPSVNEESALDTKGNSSRRLTIFNSPSRTPNKTAEVSPRKSGSLSNSACHTSKSSPVKNSPRVILSGIGINFEKRSSIIADSATKSLISTPLKRETRSSSQSQDTHQICNDDLDVNENDGLVASQSVLTSPDKNMKMSKKKLKILKTKVARLLTRRLRPNFQTDRAKMNLATQTARKKNVSTYKVDSINDVATRRKGVPYKKVGINVLSKAKSISIMPKLRVPGGNRASKPQTEHLKEITKRQTRILNKLANPRPERIKRVVASPDLSGLKGLFKTPEKSLSSKPTTLITPKLSTDSISPRKLRDRTKTPSVTSPQMETRRRKGTLKSESVELENKSTTGTGLRKRRIPKKTSDEECNEEPGLMISPNLMKKTPKKALELMVDKRATGKEKRSDENELIQSTLGSPIKRSRRRIELNDDKTDHSPPTTQMPPRITRKRAAETDALTSSKTTELTKRITRKKTELELVLSPIKESPKKRKERTFVTNETISSPITEVSNKGKGRNKSKTEEVKFTSPNIEVPKRRQGRGRPKYEAEVIPSIDEVPNSKKGKGEINTEELKTIIPEVKTPQKIKKVGKSKLETAFYDDDSPSKQLRKRRTRNDTSPVQISKNAKESTTSPQNNISRNLRSSARLRNK